MLGKLKFYGAIGGLLAIVILMIATSAQSCSNKSLKNKLAEANQSIESLEHNNRVLSENYENAKRVFEKLLGKLDAIQHERKVQIYLLNELAEEGHIQEYLTCPIPDELVDWLQQQGKGDLSSDRGSAGDGDGVPLAQYCTFEDESRLVDLYNRP